MTDFVDILIDGMAFMTNGEYVNRKRQKARELDVPEYYTEKNLLAFIHDFNQQTCSGYQLLCNIFYRHHITFSNIQIIVRLIAKILEYPIQREIYRRKRTALWWLTENIEVFKHALLGKTIAIKTKDCVRYHLTSKGNILNVTSFTEVSISLQKHNYTRQIDLRKYTNVKIDSVPVFVPEETSIQKPTVLQIVPSQFLAQADQSLAQDDNNPD